MRAFDLVDRCIECFARRGKQGDVDSGLCVEGWCKVKIPRRTPLVMLAALALTLAGCTAAHGSGGGSTSTKPSGAQPPVAHSSGAVQSPAAVSTSAAPPPLASGATRAQDIALITAMYENINRAFKINPNAGLRALIATQYPGDRADVDFARCVGAIAPGEKSLPPSTSLRFVPNTTKATADPSYTVTSARVHNLHPQGRIYETEVTITLGAQTSVHARHQVILGGKAYQFSSC